MEVRVERPKEPVASQSLACDWPDAIELVGVLELDPVLESHVPNDALLPLGLVGFGELGKAIRRGNRKVVALATSKPRSHREDGGRVPAAGEADEAGRARERRPNCVLQSSDGFNRISWSATARLGRLMVKEFDQDPTADVWVVLDLHS